MTAVGYREPPIAGKRDFARISKRAGFNRRRRGRIVGLPATERSIGFRFTNGSLDERLDLLEREFPRMLPDHVARRIHDHDRRPCIDRVAAPNAKLPVVDDGVLDAKPNRCVTNAIRYALGRVFPTVDADYCNLACEALLELPQLRKDVNAVDSAVRPEIEDEQLAAVIREGARHSSGVQPIETGGEVGRANGRRFHDG